MPKKREVVPADVGRVAAKFKLWREQKSPGERIPERLWTAAVRLSKAHGVCFVAHSLGLDYYDLKKRVDRRVSSRPPRPDRKRLAKREPGFPKFLELEISPEKPECVLELENRRGEKLRLELRGAALDLERVARLFWSRGR